MLEKIKCNKCSAEFKEPEIDYYDNDRMGWTMPEYICPECGSNDLEME